MTNKEVMQMALDALDDAAEAIWCFEDDDLIGDARRALRAALAQPEPEPIAWMHTMDNTEGCEENEPWVVLTDSDENPFGVPGEDYSETYPVISQPLYTAPKREWVGLTDEETVDLWEQSRCALPKYRTFKSLIEAKLKDKNKCLKN